MDIRKIASLAKLDLTDEDVKKLTPQLEKILHFIDQLSKVDTSQIDTKQATASSNCFLREDVLPSSPNTIKIKDRYFSVPAIIENS